MQPLRREWQTLRQTVENLLQTGRKAPTGQPGKPLTGAALKKARGQAVAMIHSFLIRLANLKVLDPACGSGNFLYVTLQKLKDLEKEVGLFLMEKGLGSFLPFVGPWQLYGIETNSYAYELAQMTVWIGYLQWTRANGFGITQTPILRSMEGNFMRKDAILDLSDPANPKEPDWPKVDFIVSNPPFLGGGMLRKQLGDEYTERLFSIYGNRIPNFSDLCCYWFEKARAHIEAGKCHRAGLLATQGIRGGANRTVLKRIKESGDIFFAVSDREWILDGANVHISMVGFDDGEEKDHFLDGKMVATINPNLSTAADVTQASILQVNSGICFMGPSPKAPFDIAEEIALPMLHGVNPHGVSNSDIIRPVASAVDLTKGSRKVWTIDFALMPHDQAAKYEQPFEYVKKHVFPIRSKNARQTNLEWWQYERPRVDMRKAMVGLDRFITTPGVAKHRIFVWRYSEMLCNQGTLVFARSDDFFFGVLHSRLHEVWALAQGTQLREKESGFRYTPTTCFETFPFPTLEGHAPSWPIPPADATERVPPVAERIAAAAKDLDGLRTAWLNPPEWTREEVLEFPARADGPWA